MAEPIPEGDEWEEFLLGHQYVRMARVARSVGLDFRSGVRWYSHGDGTMWMIGDARCVVALILVEPTTNFNEALDRVLRGETVPP